MPTGYERLHEALEVQGFIVSNGGQTVRARCPAHDDTLPSLSVSEGDNGFPLAYCHAGCSFHEVVEALGLADLNGDNGGKDRIVAQYIYTDEAGDPLFRVQRTSTKGFAQQRYLGGGAWDSRLGGARKVLYDLPRVLEAVRSGLPIYLLEGEKDVETFKATQTGAVATCWAGGALKWDDTATSLLAGHTPLYIVADRDIAGRKHASLLLSKMPSSSVLYPKEGKDFTDHVYAGFGLEDLLQHEPIEADWDDWDEEIPEFDWLVPGILARGTLVWAYGPKESAKSMYLLDIATELSRQGVSCTYYSEEMAKAQDRRRIARFGPDKRYFHWKNGRGLDLALEDHVEQVCAENRGVGLIVFDSYERVFDPPISNENKRAIAFARVAHRIIVETGATVIVIDHTGFGYRDESGNLREQRQPRGASAKEQQADMAILFSSRGKWVAGEPYKFRIENMKPGRLENPFQIDLEVVDTATGGLAVVQEGFRSSISGGEPNAREKAPGLSTEQSPPEAIVGAEVEAADTANAAASAPISIVGSGVPSPGGTELTAPAPTLSMDEARRIREYIRKGMTREDARAAVEIEKAFQQVTSTEGINADAMPPENDRSYNDRVP